MKTIRIAAALLLRPDGKTLLVRKRGTTAFMHPGGKIDPGETPQAALIRELREELDLAIDPEALAPFGRFSAVAANEPGHHVLADIYTVRTERSDMRAAAEIEELIWVSPFESGTVELAPLTVDQVFPHYRRHT